MKHLSLPKTKIRKARKSGQEVKNKVPLPEKTAQINVVADAALIEEFRDICKEQGIKQKALLINLIRQFVESSR